MSASSCGCLSDLALPNECSSTNSALGPEGSERFQGDWTNPLSCTLVWCLMICSFQKKTYNSVYQKLQVLIESVKVILQVLGVEIAEKTP